MFNEFLFEYFLDKLPQNGKIVFMGAGKIAQKMYEDVKKYRSDVKVVGFIENLVKPDNVGLPVWTLHEFIVEKPDVDLVVFSTYVDSDLINGIFDLYNILFLPQAPFVSFYYRSNKEYLNEENYSAILEMFTKEEDKQLFDLIFKVRTYILPMSNLENYYNGRYNKEGCFIYNRIKYHYLEKINKKAIKTIFDVGMSFGLNQIAFNKLLPNLEKIYGFEAIYEEARLSYIDEFILNNKLQIVPFAVGDFEGTTDFLINEKATTCSQCEQLTSMNDDTSGWKRIKVNVTTLDKYCFKSNVKPDFIKMDIEGAELPALKGGIECIRKYRPQLAISIYHSDKDFITIPLYLKNSLQDYNFSLGHYAYNWGETILYAIPNELM